MKVTLSVDRFEGELAVLLTDDGQQIDFPRALLPKGTKAGEVLSFDIKRDPGATRKLKDESRSLQNELKKRDPEGDVEL
jgi:hypothetical protein